MKKEKHLAFEQGIVDAQNEFDEWRRKRKNRRERIPADLLHLAAAKCREFPYTKVAKALKINPPTLKTLISRDFTAGIKKTKGPLDFVEMKMQQPALGLMGQTPACEITVNGRKGDSIKMTFATIPPQSFIFQVLSKIM
jgi:hypothetical protein